MKNTPAYQHYPDDIFSDPVAMRWDMEKLGAYWKLVEYLWLNSGQCRLDMKLLAWLFNVRKQTKAAKLWDSIKIKFL